MLSIELTFSVSSSKAVQSISLRIWYFALKVAQIFNLGNAAAIKYNLMTAEKLVLDEECAECGITADHKGPSNSQQTYAVSDIMY